MPPPRRRRPASTTTSGSAPRRSSPTSPTDSITTGTGGTISAPATWATTGVHELDIARWGLGVESHPSTISALGGKFAFDDDQQFPDTQTVLFDYPGDGKVGHRRQITFELRIWSPYQPDEAENGNIFYGTEGWMLLSKQGILKVYDRKNRPLRLEGEAPKHPGHHEDFVNAVRTGATPSAEIGVGFVSTALCHLGNIATRVGRTIHFDPAREQIVGDEEAARLLGRTYREDHWAIPKGHLTSGSTTPRIGRHEPCRDRARTAVGPFWRH